MPAAEMITFGSSLKLIATESLLVIEEGQPMVEEMIRGILGTPIPIKGRLSGELPRTGELNPDCVREALGLEAAVRSTILQLRGIDTYQEFVMRHRRAMESGESF